MILQVLFYAELETFVLKCISNSKSLAFPPPPPFENFWLRYWVFTTLNIQFKSIFS